MQLAPLSEISLRVESSDHQFYLLDGGTQLSDFELTQEDCKIGVKVVSNGLWIMPISDGIVEVDVAVWPTKPPLPVSGWDRVIEADVETRNGSLEVQEYLEGFVDKVDLSPGRYRARVTFMGIEGLPPCAVEGGDSYRIDLWPQGDQFSALEVQRPA